MINTKFFTNGFGNFFVFSTRSSLEKRGSTKDSAFWSFTSSSDSLSIRSPQSACFWDNWGCINSMVDSDDPFCKKCNESWHQTIHYTTFHCSHDHSQTLCQVSCAIATIGLFLDLNILQRQPTCWSSRLRTSQAPKFKKRVKTPKSKKFGEVY